VKQDKVEATTNVDKRIDYIKSEMCVIILFSVNFIRYESNLIKFIFIANALKHNFQI